MADEQDTEGTDEEDQDQGTERMATLPRKNLRELEKRAKRSAELEEQNAAIQRELAFAKAGLPLERKGISYFTKAYDGEMTPEAIRKAAEEAGFLEPPAPEVPTTERGAHQRMAEAAAGATTPPAFDYDAELAKTSSPDEVMALLQRAGVPTTWDNQ